MWKADIFGEFAKSGKNSPFQKFGVQFGPNGNSWAPCPWWYSLFHKNYFIFGKSI